MTFATASAPGLTLMSFWSRHKADCRPVSSIVADARAGKLPGVTPLPSGFGFAVVDEVAVLDAMKVA